jgi:hypothetical protein
MVQLLTNQCQDLSFSNWVSRLALCLALLIMYITHLGTEPGAFTFLPRYISDRRPAWHDRTCYF